MHIALIPIIGLLLICAIAWYALQQMSLPPPIRMVIIVVACVILILIVADMFGVGGMGHISLTELSHATAIIA